MTHVAELPVATLTAVRPDPRFTVVGSQTPDEEVLPKPSWPSVLSPQHFNTPSFNTTQVCEFASKPSAPEVPIPKDLTVFPVPKFTN